LNFLDRFFYKSRQYHISRKSVHGNALTCGEMDLHNERNVNKISRRSSVTV